MGLLDGKVVVVTGAGRGIGRGEALECAEQGAAVVVAEFDPAAGDAVVAEITGNGGRAVAVGGDVAEAYVADSLVTTAVEHFGRLDAVVNNAGILRDRTTAKLSDDEWDAVIRVHLRGHFLPTRAALRHWREAGTPGHLVHTASTSGLLGNFGQSNYGAAKAGIAAFSTIVAMEGARAGITSNAIAPTALTRMTLDLMPQEFRDQRDAALARGEFDFFAPENVAPLVSYLCSDESSHISGKVFGVQGDSVEIFQPWTSVAEVKGDGKRWDPSVLAGRIDELFGSSGIQAGPENMMARMRYQILDEH
ncbi:SDR family NAD(P)-dependent oxidoreductase [Pseudonocardia endophytica]|uniref:NAD(P)-dependent dehydrogenase (Short-subunit alcohol dehydrogenase family) n=1 Tax=Pseudonocardia endophytica TaxID=401976 RepID=A0A4R1IAP2_PSEEN|nr:SDR family NAD(P)-dependent oxidoreductase [Pseudonocardia endophytica]TCK27422.1 NAD(P)-dependent dehydrogenase (short-subunit alcohol dehydrogenase family) [Pseudonocardia endophytica]